MTRQEQHLFEIEISTPAKKKKKKLTEPELLNVSVYMSQH